MITNKGYIYLYNHYSYDKHNVYKLGKTQNILNRDSTYGTSEVESGNFILIIELNKIDIIEKLLKKCFNHLNVYKNRGTEFFDRSIINEIIPYLNKINIKYKILNQYEINNLTRPNRPVQNIINKLKLVFTVENIKKYYVYDLIIINKIY